MCGLGEICYEAPPDYMHGKNEWESESFVETPPDYMHGKTGKCGSTPLICVSKKSYGSRSSHGVIEQNIIAYDDARHSYIVHHSRLSIHYRSSTMQIEFKS